MIASSSQSAQSLVCRVAARLCAIPLAHVVEVMRPLPVEPLPGAPSFVRGAAIIRGLPVPVVDLASLLTPSGQAPARFVTVKAGGDRIVALAVDEILGVRTLPAAAAQEIPPLLQQASSEVVSAVGILDAQLLLVLTTFRLLPESVWDALAASEASR